MDLAPLVLTALGIIFVLQLITIISVMRIKNAISSHSHDSKPNEPMAEKEFRRDRFQKENRKPQFTEGHQKPAQQGPVTSVDKSLRDINLRLKNAERDQEKVRQRIGGNQEQGNRDPGRRRDRDNRDNRDNRDRDRGRGDNRDNRDRDRNRRRGPDMNRNPRNAPSDYQRPRPQQPVQQPVQQPSAPLPVAEEIVSLDVLQKNPAPVTDLNVAAVKDDAFGRGNKIIVKRRNLNGTNGNGDGAPEQQPPSLNETIPAETATPASQPQNTDQEISFGRR